MSTLCNFVDLDMTHWDCKRCQDFLYSQGGIYIWLHAKESDILRLVHILSPGKHQHNCLDYRHHCGHSHRLSNIPALLPLYHAIIGNTCHVSPWVSSNLWY